jgi:hypothetical protein
MLKLLKDETGGLSVQWIVLIVVSCILGVLIMGALLEPVKDAYQTITNRSTGIMGSGF